MDTLAGLRPTGRKIVGPASDLLEYEADNGLRHTGIQFHPKHREHPALVRGLPVVLGFLESPMVTGLVELTASDIDEGLFVYPSGKVWSVIEVVREYADMGKVCGVKAGLELCYLAGQILHEASVNGPPQGIYCHGSLTPWRLLLKGDGQVQIVGYGLPQVEVLTFLDDEGQVPPADSFRYCPPERLQGVEEDITSDIFSLALIAFELMTGQPVYDGLPGDIRQQAARAEAARKLYRMRESLPDPVREVFAKALKYDFDTRYPDANAFVWAIKDLLGAPDVEGPSLFQIMKTVKSAPRRREPLMGGMTGAIPREDLDRYADDLDEDRPLPAPRSAAPAQDVEPEDQPRWGKPVRRRGGGAAAAPSAPAPAPAPPPEPDPPAAPRGRQLRRGGGDASSKGRRQIRRQPAEGGDEARRVLRRSDADPKRRLRRSGAEGPRRIRRMSDEGGAAATDRPAPRRIRRSAGEEDPGGASQPGPRRLRRSDPTADLPPAEPEVAAAPEKPRRVRRLRRSGAEEDGPRRIRTSRGRRGRVEPPPEPEPAPPEEEEEDLGDELEEFDGLDDDSEDAEALLEKLREETGKPQPGLRSSGGGDQTFRVSVRGRAARKARLRSRDSLPECAARLVQALAVAPTDLTGQLTGWFRIEQVGAEQARRVAELNPEEVVNLEYVPNRMLRVTLEIEARGAPIRFRTPIGSAVPVAFVVAHLVEWMELHGENWSLYVGGHALQPWQILDDLGVEDGDTLNLRR